MAKTQGYNELEHLVLAMVAEGISSGYAIRKELTKTRNSRWSSESGAVYRVLRRLAAFEEIVETGKAGAAKRERTEYQVTEKGNETLRTWLREPPGSKEISYLVDPLRTRSYFLNRLPVEQQIEMVAVWLAESKAYRDEVERDLARPRFKTELRNMGYANLLCLAEARTEWLRNLLAFLKEQESDSKINA